MIDSGDSWDRQPGEPARWHERFTIYRRMGPRRSILGAAKLHREQTGGARAVLQLPGYWLEISEKWRWKQRAEEWDQAEAEREERTWQERRHQHRENEYQVGQELLARARAMMEWPLERRETRVEEDGLTVVNVTEPARWTARDITVFAEVWSKLVQQAVGADPANPPANTVLFGMLSNVPDDQLATIYSNLAILLSAGHPGDAGGGPPAQPGSDASALGDPAPRESQTGGDV